MTSKTTPIYLAIVCVLLGISSVFFYQSAASESRLRIQRDRDLTQTLAELAQKEAQIAELNLKLSSLRETSVKRINSLEMAAREREETAKILREELGQAKKQREEALSQSLEKNQKIEDLNGCLDDLRKEKEALAEKVSQLQNQVIENQPKQTVYYEEENADHLEITRDSGPYGIMSDNDQGLSIDTVNLGSVVISKKSGRAARVQEVNSIHSFIITNTGEKDGIYEGAVLNIVRNNTLIGKAVVRRARANVSAAVILPDWEKEQIQRGDLITKF